LCARRAAYKPLSDNVQPPSSCETSWGLACAGVVEKGREKRRKGERSKYPLPAVPDGEKGCDSKWCILWQRGNAFIP